MKDYGKEYFPIAKKYDMMHAHYYRRMLCAAAKNLPWNEPMPELSYTEWANRKVKAALIVASKSAEEHKLEEKVIENQTN